MSRRYLRPGVLVGHVLVLAAALICLRLGWWQWNVFEYAARGTVQNLGYALLWPVFSGSFIYMWLRFLHLESVQEAGLAPAGGVAGDLVSGDGGGDGEPAGSGSAREPRGRDGADDDALVPGEPSRGADRLTGAAPVTAGDGEADDAAAGIPEDAGRDGDVRPARPRPQAPSTAYTVAVATVGDDDDDDPELAAYNRALAALAEQDRRRAR